MANKDNKTPALGNILIAEDNLEIRAQLLRALGRLAKCTVVDNGPQAITAYQKAVKNKRPFDFILLDVTMPASPAGPADGGAGKPTTDGFDVLKAIRASEESSPKGPLRLAKIIMITAYQDSLMKNYNMGWDEYITKPVDIEKLIACMHRLSQVSL